MDFASSTHKRNWLLSETELEERAQRSNSQGTEHVLQLRRDHSESCEGLRPLTVAEEAKVVLYYSNKLASTTVRDKRPRKVIATAITFLKRFYLDHSIMEHDALRIMLTCLYVAGKACESYKDADEVASIATGIKGKTLLEMETVVLQGLRFELVVYEVYTCIDCMIEELRVAHKSGDEVVSRLLAKHADGIKLVHSLAKSFADSIIQSSAPLTMRPQQQALCAVCHALVKYGLDKGSVVRRYVAKADCSDTDGDQAAMAASMQEVLARGDQLATAGHARVCKEEVTLLDKKVRAFNPKMDSTSELYKKLKKKRKRNDD